jgi:hypothetical protein
MRAEPLSHVGQETVLPLYYPNVLDPDMAVPIDVVASSVQNIEFRVGAPVPVTVSGSVVGPGRSGLFEEGDSPQVFLFVADEGTDIPVTSLNTVREDGEYTFSVPAVPYRTYDLIAMERDLEGHHWVGRRTLGLLRDEENVTIVLEQEATVSGRLWTQGRQLLDLSSVQVRLRPTHRRLGQYSVHAEAEVAADGRFVIEGVPRFEYRLAVLGLPQGTYISSATLNGGDILHSTFVVGGESVIEIGTRSDVGTISGTVLDQDGGAGVTALVFLVSANWRQINRDIASSIHAVYGRSAYRFSNVPPGDYWLVAVAGEAGRSLVGDRRYYSRGVVDRLIRGAERIVLRSGGDEVQDLVATSYED